MVYVLDPNNRVLKRLWCIKNYATIKRSSLNLRVVIQSLFSLARNLVFKLSSVVTHPQLPGRKTPKTYFSPNMAHISQTWFKVWQGQNITEILSTKSKMLKTSIKILSSLNDKV